MKRGRKIWKIILSIALVLVIAFFAIYINHTVQSGREAALLEPLGQLVEVEGGSMSVYTAGSGEQTLVFLSGGGTCAPILDFRSLYSRLSDTYRIAVVEKFGYGFSDDTDRARDIDSILSDTRAALRAAGVEPPYVLCPHSMSGLEALYWAQTFPEEITAIVGLDMAVPEYYDSMEINLPLMRLGQWAVHMGIARLIPGIAESDAITHGALTEDEAAIYRALFYRRTASEPMLREAATVRDNAETVRQLEVPQVPMLLFLSDGSGGTGFDEETWRSIPKEHFAGMENVRFVELDCPHYVHDWEYEQISGTMIDFLSGYND